MAPGQSGALRRVGALDTPSQVWEAPCVTVSKRLLLTLALLSLAFGVASWIIEGITPSWVVFPIFLVVGLVRSRKGGSYGIVWLGVSALVFLLVHLPFDKAALSKHCVNPTGADKACHRVFWLISLGVVPLLMVATAAVAFRAEGGSWRLPWSRASG
jgi:hypothetical protein